MTKLKYVVPIIFRWLIAIGLLGLVLYKIDSETVWKALQRFNPVFGAIMIAVNITLLMLMALRWKLIAEKISVNADYVQYLRAVWLGALSGQIGPPLIFTEVTRFKAIQNHGGSRQLISSQILDRLSGQIILILLLLLLMPVYWPLLTGFISEHWLIRAALIIFVLIVVTYSIVKFHKGGKVIDYKQISNLLNPVHGLSHYGVSLLIQLVLMACFMLAMSGLGSLQQPLIVMSLLPLVLTSLMLLPISVSDWGTRETAAVFFLSFSGLSAEEITAASLIYGAAWSLTAVLGLFFLCVKPQQ